MAVDDGPSHLATNDYIVYSSDLIARALASRFEELTLLYPNLGEESRSFLSVPTEFQGFGSASAEKSTPGNTWSYPRFASSTIQQKSNLHI